MDHHQAKRISIGILLCGLLAAAAIYFTAAPERSDPMGYDPLAQKKYLRQMERLGGKANVLSAEIQDWFATLWHGRPLAGTVAVTTCVVAWGFWFVATLPPLDETKNAPLATKPTQARTPRPGA